MRIRLKYVLLFILLLVFIPQAYAEQRSNIYELDAGEDIQTAIDNCAAGGCKIILASGTYTITSAINFASTDDYIILEGSGPSTLITTATDSISLLTVTGVAGGDQALGIVVRDIRFTNTASTKTSTGISITACDDCLFERLHTTTLTQASNGVEIWLAGGSDRTIIRANTLVDWANRGIYLQGSSNDNIIADNLLTCSTGCAAAGIELYNDPARTTIKGNHIVQSTGAGHGIQIFRCPANSCNEVTNGTFTGDASGWTLNSGWAYNSNNVRHTGSGTGTMEQDIGVTAADIRIGRRYSVTYTISSYVAGNVTVSLGGGTGQARSANGTYTEIFTPSSTAVLAFTPASSADLIIDTVIAGGEEPYETIISQNHIEWNGATGTPIDIEGSRRGIISDNIITNVASSRVAIYIAERGEYNVPAYGWVITGNRCTEAFRCIGVYKSHNITITGNNNYSVSDDDDFILLDQATYVTITGNFSELATGGSTEDHIVIGTTGASTDIMVSGNNFRGGDYGIEVVNGAVVANRVMVIGNVFTGGVTTAVNAADSNDSNNWVVTTNTFPTTMTANITGTDGNQDGASVSIVNNYDDT